MTSYGRARGGEEGTLLRITDPGHVFEGASKGACRRLRDGRIPDTSSFDEDGRLAVILKWSDREVWQARRDGEWKDICFRRST